MFKLCSRIQRNYSFSWVLFGGDKTVVSSKTVSAVRRPFVFWTWKSAPLAVVEGFIVNLSPRSYSFSSSRMSDTDTREDKGKPKPEASSETDDVMKVPQSASEREESSAQEEDEVAPLAVISRQGASFSVTEIEIELTDDLKAKLVTDLSSICSVDAATARGMLKTHKWNMQRAIDNFFEASGSEDENNDSTDDVKILSGSPPKGAATPGNRDESSSTAVVTLNDVTSPEADSKKEKEVEMEKTNSNKKAKESYSSWAPEKLSIISWNLDGLDEKNLEKRTDAVVDIILRENHDVVFFQELIPQIFDYIGRRLRSKYMPIPGTENPKCEYLTGTFLKLNHIHYEDHYIVPFPNTVMDRNILVTKAFIGQAKIALLNTHLESTAEFSVQRTAQLKMCFEIAQSFPPEYNILFGGDLNLRDTEIVGLLPGDMSDLWVRCGSRTTCKFTWDLTRNTNKQMPSRFQPRCRFDRFYFRSSTPATLSPEFFGVTGIEKVVNTQSFPSDHWAIVTFFRLSKEARKPAAKKRKLEEAEVESL